MKDPLFGNKLAAAVLTALLLFFGLPQLAGILLGTSGHHAAHGGDLHLAYPIEYKTGSGGEAAAPQKSLAELLAEADPARGERRVALCKSCHTLDEGGANGTGPNLWAIVGRAVASVDGFAYTSALQSFGGDWTFERLDKYLEDSSAYIDGTAMVQIIRKAEQRAELIVYLNTLSANPLPLPEPVIAEAVEQAVGEAVEAAATEAPAEDHGEAEAH